MLVAAVLPILIAVLPIPKSSAWLEWKNVCEEIPLIEVDSGGGGDGITRQGPRTLFHWEREESQAAHASTAACLVAEGSACRQSDFAQSRSQRVIALLVRRHSSE